MQTNETTITNNYYLVMKRILFLFLIFGCALSTKAQFPMGGGAPKITITGRITAVLLDSATKLPVDYATVSLIRIKDSKSVNGAVTDAKGKITLQNVAPDQY
ncbi:MAG: hypothetical protein MUP99_10365, partial [Pedobacter sp.]|nr:hypothetical protein [Pedobacter sp.]